MEDTLILYPSPAMGHLISMVEFGKLILHHYPSFSITILISKPPFSTGSTSDYIAKISSTSSLSFHHIHPSSSLSSTISVAESTFELFRLCNPNLQEFLQTLLNSAKIKALILDFFSFSAMEVAEKLQIPTYFFNTSSATVLSSFLHFPTIHNTTKGNLKDLKSKLRFPGCPPINGSDFIDPLLVRDTKIYKEFLKCSLHISKSKGIIVNSFGSLEPAAFKAFTGRPAPPVFAVGPLVSIDEEGYRKHECIRWLNLQPRKSVVFLCFGSLGLFSREQLTDIAAGIENSGRRFLWVVRTPPEEKSKMTAFYAPPEPNLDELLPAGFFERTKHRGLVVKSWAPQAAVLSHDSVGGFVTHCGWNSVLEAVCAGVPMLAWPLYAEQRLNRVWLVEEAKVALAVNESKDGFVNSTELEDRVNELMDSESGKRVRERILVLREEAMVALKDGGSSLLDLAELAESWKSSTLKE